VQKKRTEAVFLLFPLILAGVFGAYVYSSVSNNHSLPCMQIVPYTANVTATGNTTYFGYDVSYPNGTNSYYSLGACPSPVHQILYDVVYNVTQDPRFIAAEGGANYVVDPVNSLTGPQGNGNGSLYALLIFNDMNLSSTIYPCNLNFAYKSTITEIRVLIPMTLNGTLTYQNETVMKYPGSALNYNCPPETGLTTFAKSQIPNQFNVGNFTFDLISNSTNYAATNGTSYPGYDYAFNVTYPSDNLSESVVFTWPTASALASNQVPSPFISVPYQGYAVMRWFTNSTGLYLTVTTLA
jgi:hypothetical protein